MPGQNMVGQKLKSFHFLRKLGEGSWANVYEAVDDRDNCQVAVKVIPRSLMRETPKLEQLVKTEIKVLKDCRNENVIRFVDSFYTDQAVFISTEFCNGGDLEEYLARKKRLTEDQATNFLRQIINGFKGLHEVHAMHRDFKTANILLHNGTCKIADLGFAKQMEKKSMAKTILGTSLTMAPQVLDERPYGIEADIWSVGVVYYQLLYGKYPYQGLSDPEILKRIRKDRPNFTGVEISSNARDFIDKSLTVDPKKRITWAEIYEHPLINKKDAGMIYGSLKSKISLTDNKKLYEKGNLQINEGLMYPELKGQGFNNDYSMQEVDDGAIRQSMNYKALLEEQTQKQNKEATFLNYEKKYLAKRNNIMFVFKFIVPYVPNLQAIKANHNISIFIMCKQAYIEMNEFHNDMKKKKNIFSLDKYWNDFTSNNIYKNILQQVENDNELICAMSIGFMSDIGMANNEIMAECDDLNKAASKNWKKLLQDTVNEYWFLLAEGLQEISNKWKGELLKVLEALYFYKSNKSKDIEEFDRIIEVINYQEAEKDIKVKLQSVLSS